MADNKPPTLDEWKGIIINPTAPFCDQFKKIPRAFALLLQWFTWAFGADGKTPTVDFLNALTGGTGVVPGVAPGQVQGVVASTGLAGYIYVSWSSMASATLYYIYRSATNDFSTATNVGSTATLGFSEKDVAGGGTLVDGTTYYYWVKGWNNSGYGTESTSAAGSCIVGSSTTQVNDIPGTYSIVVPAGMTHLTSYVWGGGGGGGIGDVSTASNPWWPVVESPPGSGHWVSSNPNPNATFGGGGGGGGYATTVNTVVVAGQTVTVVVGNGGNVGEGGVESYVSYAAAVVARATGGSPGATHSGGAGGIKDVGDSGAVGSSGSQGTGVSGGTGGNAGNSAGLPTGQTAHGMGGTGGASTGAGATPGQNGFVKVVFSA